MHLISSADPVYSDKTISHIQITIYNECIMHYVHIDANKIDSTKNSSYLKVK